MKNLLKNHPLPVQIEGFPYIFGGFLLTVAAAVPGFIAATVVFALFTAFSIWFYRCPRIQPPSDDPAAVLSPADGRVLAVEEAPGELIGEPKARRVSVFMSPLDVHVNRAPVSGVIESIDYTRGKFFRADLDKASEENERNRVVLRSDTGPKVAFTQIAGFIARRIVCYVAPGERLSRGERYGMIRFGSRMEILVPSGSEILVTKGDRTVAGFTKLARLAR